MFEQILKYNKRSYFSRFLPCLWWFCFTLLLPILTFQVYRLWKTTPRLPPAKGESTGAISGQHKTPMRLFVTGESTSIGVGVSRIEESLAIQLANALVEFSKTTVSYEISGANGLTASQLLQHLKSKPLQGEAYDLVVIVLGVNDALHLSSAKKWVNNLVELMRFLSEKQSDSPSFLLTSVPDLGQFPGIPMPLAWLLSWRSKMLNQQAKEVFSRIGGVEYFQFALPLAAELFAEDQFHPGKLGYQIWAKELAKVASSVFDN